MKAHSVTLENRNADVAEQKTREGMQSMLVWGEYVRKDDAGETSNNVMDANGAKAQRNKTGERLDSARN